MTDEIQGLQVNIQSLDEEIKRYSNQGDRVVVKPLGEPTGIQVSLPQHAGASLVSLPRDHRNDIVRIARDHQVSLVSWNVGHSGQGREMEGRSAPVQVQLEGDYHQIAQCLSGILHLPWAHEITQLRIMRSNTMDKDPSSLVADFRLVGI